MYRVRKLWWARPTCRSGTRAASTRRGRTALTRVSWLFRLVSGLGLEGGARSVIRFEEVLPEAVPYVGYAPVDIDGPVGVLVDVSLKPCDLVRFVVHLAHRLYAEYEQHPRCMCTHDLRLGLPNPSRETKFIGANASGKYHFSLFS